MMKNNMPYSDNENNKIVEEYIGGNKKIKTVVDFGAGAGKYGKMIKTVRPDIRVIAYEVWEDYIKTFKLPEIYDEVIMKDMLTLEFPEADLAIFGDVLEHFSRDDFYKILYMARQIYPRLVFAIPLGVYEQGAVGGVPYEEHKSTWEWDELCDLLRDCDIKIKGRVCGIFIKI
jgi:hypothetical protein